MQNSPIVVPNSKQSYNAFLKKFKRPPTVETFKESSTFTSLVDKNFIKLKNKTNLLIEIPMADNSIQGPG